MGKILLIASLFVTPVAPVTVSQSINNRLDTNNVLQDTDMRNTLIALFETQSWQRERREHIANMPACPINPSRYWNLSCA